MALMTRIVLFLSLIISSRGMRTYLDDEHETLQKILKDYDWRIRPPGNGPNGTGPVIVYTNMLVRSISNVDEANMAYDMQITFREQWNDSRLAYGKPNDGLPSFITLNKEQDIWRPDTFFANEKSSHRHEIDRPNILIRIHKDGQVLYSVRISLTLSCPMNFQYYPLDVQNCLLDFASYAYTTEDIEYRWKDGLDPVQIKAGVTASLPQFFLKNLLTDTCTSVTNTGHYSCLRTTLKLTRLFGYHLFHVYLPGAMLVIISWVSFWLDPSAVLGRVTLGVATLLTMVTQSANVNYRLPPVSYIKAIDVWIGMCTCFLFGALIEFAIVHFLYNKHLERNRQILEDEASQRLILDDSSIRLDRNSNTSLLAKYPILNLVMGKIKRDAKIIDAFSRIIFPITFVICNVIYWRHYTKEKFKD